MKKKVVKKHEVDLANMPTNDLREGKALLNLALGLLLIGYGFGLLTFASLATVAGALFCLKGLVQFLKK